VGATLALRVQTGDADGPARLATIPVGSVGPGTAISAETPIGADTPATMLRDARLDRYLLAHHGMRAGAAAALPGGGVRNVDMLVPAR
jgi:hypothetical protein